MTISQIKAMGLPTDQWISLGGFCDLVTLLDDNNFYVDDAQMQFYFDSDGVMFVRYTTGKPRLANKSTPSDGYVFVIHDGAKYELALRHDGVSDNKAGKYHDVISLFDISGFLTNK